MITKLIPLQTLKCSLSRSTNQYITEQTFVSFFFFLSGASWWNRPITVLISSPMLQMTGPHYLQQPWRLWSYWFSEIQFYFFFFFLGLWMVSSRRGGQRKQPRGSRLCDWQLSITRQQDESHPLEEALQWREREGGGGGGRPSLPYLSFSFTAPLLSPCLVIALTLTFHSPALSPQTHVNNSRYQADP